MTPDDLVRFPLTCPECKAQAGMPYLARTMLNGAVCVGMRCLSCGHEWEFELAANNPKVTQKPDRRKTPRT